MAHQVTILCEVVEVPCNVNDLGQVVIGVLLICRVLDRVEQADEVLVSDGELFEQPILLEQSEAEMNERVFPQSLAVGKHIKVPLVKLIHHLEYDGPLSRINIDHLPNALLILLYLILIDFNIISVELFEEVIQISFKPLCCVIASLCCYVKPCLCLNILRLVVEVDVHCQVV